VTNILKTSAPVRSQTEYRTIVLIILAVALVLRLAWAALIPVIPISDGIAYDQLARVLAEHGVYGWAYDRPSANWPVGTSAIYAALYFMFGHSFVPIVAVNIAMSTSIVGMTMWLGRVFLDERTAVIAGGLMAIWPTNVIYVTILSSELPFIFLFLLGFVAWYNLRISNSVRAVASGLAFGAASYVRPVALLLPIVVWLTAVPNWRKLRTQLTVLLLALAVTGVAIAPWTIRNTKLFGHPVLISTNGGTTLWIGNNPNSDGYFMPGPASPQVLNEYERDNMFGQEARRYIFENPALFFMRGIKKALLLHTNETIAVHWNAEGIKQRFGESAIFPLKLLTQGFWTAVLLFAFAGLFVMTKEHGIMYTLANPAVLTWAYFTAFYSIFFVSDRYHIPSHPFIAMLAANAILFVATRTPQNAIEVQR
jgi:4-amino-4-deoxy-L-arabinose transferase-like glycosyltransferase